MKDPVFQEVAAAAYKLVPSVLGTITTTAQGLSRADLVAISTLVYICVLTATTIMRNWGDWSQWLGARFAALRRFGGGRGH